MRNVCMYVCISMSVYVCVCVYVHEYTYTHAHNQPNLVLDIELWGTASDR